MEERPQGHEIRKGWGGISYYAKCGLNMIIFIEIWLRKWKRKYNGILDPKVYLENGLSEVCSYLFGRLVFSKYKS